MKIRGLCPNCGRPVSVTGRDPAGWAACNKCGHVFKLSDSLDTNRRKSALPANSPHLGLQP
jgi:ribosomal protein L37AE/L43A